MDELDRLFPAAVEIGVAGRTFSAAPLAVRQFAPMMRALQPVQPMFLQAAREVDLDALLASPAAVDIIAIGLKCEMDFVLSLRSEERLAALLPVIAVNADFFFPEPAAEAGPEAETDFTTALVDAFQRLISAGHPWREVQDYTLAQVALFDAAIGRLRNDEGRTALLSARAAGAAAPVFKTMLKALGG